MANPTVLSTILRASTARLKADTEASLVARAEPIRAAIESGHVPVRPPAQGAIPATVVAGLGGNRYLVDVDGEQMPVVLRTQGANATLEPGSTIRLIFQPQSPPPATGAAAAAPASGETQLSPIARMIAAATRPGSGDASVVKFAPLDVPPQKSHQLADALQRSVASSGLFYESHVAEWVSGRRSIADLQREPQAQFRPQAPPPDGDGTPSPGPIAAVQQSSEPQAGAIVREQLNVLATQQIIWRGEVWPDQAGEIELTRDPAAVEPSDDGVWRARIQLVLPTLGEVDIKLALRANRLELDLRAPSESSADVLDAGRAPLAAALEARGLLVSAHVARDDHDA